MRTPLASLADLPGIAEMKAAGLLEMNLPPGFTVPDPLGLRPAGDEEDSLELDDGETPEFAQGFLGAPEKAAG